MHRCAAVLLGVAAAIAVAGLFHTEPPGDFASAGDQLNNPVPPNLLRAITGGTDARPVTPGAHGNATTDSDANVRLNPHFLIGKPTTICTAEPTLVAPLAAAIKAWEDRIGAIGFDVIANPTPCVNPDVRVQFLNQCAYSVELGGILVTKHNPCYLADRLLDRDVRVFKYKKTAPALIAYPTHTPIRVSSLIHEIGHVLGLPDYDSKAAQDATTCDAVRSIDADPQLDDVVIMAPRGNACRSPKLITERDMRDLHEAYRAPAITDVGVSVTKARKNRRSATKVTVTWSKAGQAEAEHNAKYVALYSRAAANGSWQFRASESIRVGSQDSMQKLSYKTTGTVPGEHKLVALTRAGTLDGPGAARVNFQGGSDTSSQLYFEGDPTIIRGVSTAANALIVSASASPVYCYPTTDTVLSAASELRQTEVSWTISGGRRSNTVRIGSHTSTDNSGSHAYVCAGAPSASELSSGRPVRVAVTSGSGNAALTETVTLGLTVLPVLPKVDITSVTTDPLGGCIEGDTVDLTIEFANPIPAGMRAWIDDTEITLGTGKQATASVTCRIEEGKDKQTINVFALSKSGGDRYLKSIIPRARFSFTASSSWQDCAAGTVSVPVSWAISGGSPPYAIRQVGGVSRMTSDRFGTITATCPSISGSTISLTASDSTTPPQQKSAVLAVRSVEALRLAADGGNLRPGCTPGGTVRLTWGLSGGRGPYSISVAGSVATPESAFAVVRCQPNAGTQTFTVTVNDASQPAQRAALAINVDVIEPRPALALTSAATTSRHCVAGSRDVPITWSVSGGKPPYRVSAGGTAVSASAASGNVSGVCPASGSLITIAVEDSSSPSQRVTGTVSITRVAPLTLVRSGGVPACTTGGQATLNWRVSGGTPPYAVSIDGKRVASGSSSVTVRCGTTFGAQSFSYRVSDASTPQLVDSGTISATVRRPPAPATIDVTGKLVARKRSDGRVEFCFLLSGQTMRSCPTGRYVTPTSLAFGSWIKSTDVSAVVNNQQRTLGKITVARLRRGSLVYLDVCFTPQGGSRLCPTKNEFRYLTATVDSWLSTNWFTFTIRSGGLSGSSADEEDVMETGPADDGGGTDTGQLMGGDDA